MLDGRVLGPSATSYTLSSGRPRWWAAWNSNSSSSSSVHDVNSTLCGRRSDAPYTSHAQPHTRHTASAPTPLCHSPNTLSPLATLPCADSASSAFPWSRSPCFPPCAASHQAPGVIIKVARADGGQRDAFLLQVALVLCVPPRIPPPGRFCLVSRCGQLAHVLVWCIRPPQPPLAAGLVQPPSARVVKGVHGHLVPGVGRWVCVCWGEGGGDDGLLRCSLVCNLPCCTGCLSATACHSSRN